MGRGDRADSLRYAIFDPTGNITALVEGSVAAGRQPEVAACIMGLHPDVEQVGFVRRLCEAHADGPSEVELRMAGGEFCGNATMSAAAWQLLHAGHDARCTCDKQGVTTVTVRASGASHPVEVRLEPLSAEVCEERPAATGMAFAASVRMPEAQGVEEHPLSSDGTEAMVPVVRMEGISHAVIEEGSPFFGLMDDAAAAERAVRAWCAELQADGLGLMFLSGDAPSYRLTPLVYVPCGDTVFWEHSCASGSAAVGIYLAARSGRAVSLALAEPGGTLRVRHDPVRGVTWLAGSVHQQGELKAMPAGAGV